MLRAISICSLVVACGLMAWAGYSALQTEPFDAPPTTIDDIDECGVVIENGEQQLGKVPSSGASVEFHVVNHSNQTATLVGGTNGCSAAGCFGLIDKSKMTIPPGASARIAGHFSVNEGPFEFRGNLYFNDRGQRPST